MANVKRLFMELEENASEMKCDIREIKGKLHEVNTDIAFLLLDYIVNNNQCEPFDANFGEDFMDKTSFKDLCKLEELHDLINELLN